jgi:hypothetical protein
MVSTNQLTFNEPKRLPALDYLLDEFDFIFDTKRQCLRKKWNNSNLLLRELTYSLADLTSDYYQLDFVDFKRKIEYVLQCKTNNDGYLIGKMNYCQ